MEIEENQAWELDETEIKEVSGGKAFCMVYVDDGKLEKSSTEKLKKQL